MTLKEFFRRARRKVWQRDPWGLVRCESGLCPLAAVTGEWVPEVAATQLRMSKKIAWRIANAADNKSRKDRPWLLKQLGVRA